MIYGFRRAPPAWMPDSCARAYIQEAVCVNVVKCPALDSLTPVRGLMQ